jgi:hypothetical protein
MDPYSEELTPELKVLRVPFVLRTTMLLAADPFQVVKEPPKTILLSDCKAIDSTEPSKEFAVLELKVVSLEPFELSLTT